MRSKATWWLRLAGMLAGMACAVCSAQFAPPAEGPVPFRRDQIPMDAEAMEQLSGRMVAFARALPMETAAERRAAAQMLALAIALAPQNENARKLIRTYRKYGCKPQLDIQEVGSDFPRVWKLIAWLESPQAGAHGQALASCLRDAMVITDPESQQAVDSRETGEKGAWAGWVPDIHAYEAPEISRHNPPNASPPETTSADPAKPSGAANDGPSGAAPRIQLQAAEVQTVMWRRALDGQSAQWSLAPAPLQMSAAETDETQQPSFAIGIGPGDPKGPLTDAGAALERLLEHHLPALPNNARIQITSREFEKSLESGRPQSISAAAAVLASAAITGREPEAVIIGEVDEYGSFNLPARFWDQLLSLGPAGGRRLILPAAAADYLPSLLAMENPGFFMDCEVLLARDFRDLVDLAAKIPEGSVADAAAKFREIRERAANQDLRLYLANRFIRQRLEELSQQAPFHASAAILHLQAAGRRPTSLARVVLAAELRRTIDPMDWLARYHNMDITGAESARIGRTHETCRARVEEIERRADKTDQDLTERARSLIITLRNLDRAARARGGSDSEPQTLRAALTEFIRLHRELGAELASETGETPAPSR